MTVLLKKLLSLPRLLYQNLTKPRLHTLTHRSVLQRNRQLKNSQSGKRCFILGTGPSISTSDLAALRTEQVFVVNDFIKHKKFSALNPAYYVVTDTSYFDSERELDFFGRNLKNKSDQIPSSTKLFFNIEGKNLIERRKLFQQHDIYYLSIQGMMSENFDFNIDLDKTLPFTKNVILTCLMIAVYLGFEEIYLLGCEHSFLAKPIRQGVVDDIDHFYGVNYENLNPNDAQAIKEQGYERVIVLSYEATMSHVRQLFRNYRFFYKKIRRLKPNVRIWNATPESYLDVFSFVNFKDITFLKKQ